MKIIVSIYFFCCSYILSAQQNRFMYLQMDNKQPFYIKLNKKVFSSSESGYVIIPKLAEGSYSFQVGFPKNGLPEQTFNYSIGAKDIGFIIKNFGEKGWGLFNLQSLDIIMAGISDKQSLNSESAQVSSSTIDSSNIGQVAHSQEDTLQFITPPKPRIIENAAISSIKKLSEVQNDEGVNMVFIDISPDHMDTVQLFIPLQELQGNENPEQVLRADSTPVDKSSNIESSNSKIVTDSAAVDNTTAKNEITTSVISENTDIKNDIVILERRINSSCKRLADEEDFLNLRKKMAAEKNDDDMISVAKKNFKSRCYTTEQVKNLSLLFLKDQDKYKFYDVAYPSVFDLHNFNTLQNQLSDDYFINRFKAMIHP
ncbi:MAG: DUF4476 domain-containing protein [Chitinophagaceae bacterium]|nr:DUF4476 domain-containing protein [Chitinophagaceae bacterium]